MVPMPHIELTSGLVATRPMDLVEAILHATDQQASAKAIADAAGRTNSASVPMGTLNYWRLAWRCAVEWGEATFRERIAPGGEIEELSRPRN